MFGKSLSCGGFNEKGVEGELERICTDRIELTSGGPVAVLNIPAGQWHTIKAIESGSVVLECKDGPWEPTGDEDILK